MPGISWKCSRRIALALARYIWKYMVKFIHFATIIIQIFSSCYTEFQCRHKFSLVAISWLLTRNCSSATKAMLHNLVANILFAENCQPTNHSFCCVCVCFQQPTKNSFTYLTECWGWEGNVCSNLKRTKFKYLMK